MSMSNVNSLIAELKVTKVPSIELLQKILALPEKELPELFQFSNNIRQEFIGDGILLRGIVEFSSYCDNPCAYCGLNSNNKSLSRYRMTRDEVLLHVRVMYEQGIRTVVLQAGEEKEMSATWLAGVITAIKDLGDIAITLSVGERPRADYKLWKDVGADRYLLKIETSNKALYEKLHRGMSYENRLRCLDDLFELSYQTGSGIIIGLPGQTLEILAGDLLFFQKRDFDMLGIGPFIPHGSTELAEASKGDHLLTLKMIALTRILCPRVHLPATTALGSLEKDYRIEALKAGANVLMPNFSPPEYRSRYEIYPGKRCITEPVGACVSCFQTIAKNMGRYIDLARGDAVYKKNRYALKDVPA